MTNQSKRQIDRATNQEAGKLAELIRSSFADVAHRFQLTPENCPKHPSNCTDEWIKRDLDRGVHFFVLTSESGLVGCVGVEKASETNCYMERLAVLPGHRGQGYGSQLAHHALDHAKSMGASTVGIGIIAADEGLRDFYLSLGFEEGETKTFPHLPFEVAFMHVAL